MLQDSANLLELGCVAKSFACVQVSGNYTETEQKPILN